MTSLARARTAAIPTVLIVPVAGAMRGASIA
jgi:hypothetical protein